MAWGTRFTPAHEVFVRELPTNIVDGKQKGSSQQISAKELYGFLGSVRPDRVRIAPLPGSADVYSAGRFSPASDSFTLNSGRHPLGQYHECQSMLVLQRHCQCHDTLTLLTLTRIANSAIALACALPCTPALIAAIFADSKGRGYCQSPQSDAALQRPATPRDHL
jgi:hypothetical protein